MFQLLTEYFFQMKKLYVPGTGTFVLEPRNAENDFTTQKLQAPGWNIVFTPITKDANADDVISNEGLPDWLAYKLKLSKGDASLKFNKFYDRLKADLDNGKTVNWLGLGTLLQVDKLTGFTPNTTTDLPFTEVSAKKVLRQNASHDMSVGERETTTDQMQAQFAEEKPVGSLRKKIAWILVIISLGLLALYFLQYGCSLKNTGSQQKVEVQKPYDNYRLR